MADGDAAEGAVPLSSLAKALPVPAGRPDGGAGLGLRPTCPRPCSTVSGSAAAACSRQKRSGLNAAISSARCTQKPRVGV